MNQNYSYDTSLPAYNENPSLRKRQRDEVFAFIKRGANNLLQIERLSGLPSARISARMSELMEEKRAKYEGFTIYENRKRKRIVAIKQETSVTQNELFQ